MKYMYMYTCMCALHDCACICVHVHVCTYLCVVLSLLSLPGSAHSHSTHVYTVPTTMKHRTWTLLLVIWATSLAVGQNTTISNANVTTLHILLIAPFPDSIFNVPYDGGHNLIPSALLAVDEINQNPTILPDYHLEPVIGDGGCTITEKAVSRALENIVHRSSEGRVVGIVGPVCSEATEALSALVNRKRIQMPLVTIANNPVLGNVNRFPFTYGIVSTSAEYAGTVVKVYTEMKKVGKWKEIAIYYEGNRPYNLELYRAVRRKIDSEEGVDNDDIYSSPITDKYMPLEDMMARGIRIGFVFASKDPACKLMCLAANLGMTHPTYQFLLTDRRLGQFQSCVNDSEEVVITHNSKTYRCSNDDIVQAMTAFVLFYYNLEGLRLEPNTTQAVSGYTFSEYRRRYEERLHAYNFTVEGELNPSAWAAPFYDAVWAVALAVNRTIPHLNFSSQLATWDEGELIDAFDELNFRGVSTRVNFNPDTGFSHSVINISQLVYDENKTISNLVGYYNAGILFDASDRNSSSDVLSLYINSAFDTSTEKIPLWLSVPGYILTVLVFAATVTYHILHFHFRKRPSIKAVSPQLNHLIFLGCYVILGSVLLDTTDAAFTPEDTFWHLFLCYTVVWLENIGIAFVFSTLFVKYYRLYLVFLKTYDHRSNLSNGKLSLIAVALVFIEFAILAIWVPFRPLEIISTVDLDHTTEPPIYREKRICVTTDVGRWFTIATSTYLALLILAVVTLSILNRRIKQRDFNTTAATNFLVYLYILLLSILLPTVYIDSNYGNIDLKYGIINALYLTFTVLCLIFLFTPPLLLRNQRSRKYSLASQLQKISNIVALNRITRPSTRSFELSA